MSRADGFRDMFSRGKKGKASGGGGLAIGIAIGVALGVALDNIAVGIAIGIAIGVSLGAAQRGRKPSPDQIDQDESSQKSPN